MAMSGAALFFLRPFVEMPPYEWRRPSFFTGSRRDAAFLLMIPLLVGKSLPRCRGDGDSMPSCCSAPDVRLVCSQGTSLLYICAGSLD